MGRYCRICHRTRANEKFSGRGHRNLVCNECARMPKAQRDAIEQRDEIFGYLGQSRVSEKNMARLAILAQSSDADVAELATLALEVARVRPYRRKRLQVLARDRRDLLDALDRTELIYAHP